MLTLKWERDSEQYLPEARAVVIRPGAVFKCRVFWRHLNSWPANVRTFSVSQLSFNCLYKKKRERTIKLTRSFSSEAVLKFRSGLPPHSLLSLPALYAKETYQRPRPCAYENLKKKKPRKLTRKLELQAASFVQQRGDINIMQISVTTLQALHGPSNERAIVSARNVNTSNSHEVPCIFQCACLVVKLVFLRDAFDET